MKDRNDLALGWFRKADSDLTAAEVILGTSGPYDTVCFHAHQAAEKYLKGFLSLQGIAIPRSHDLLELNRLCGSLASVWVVDKQLLAELMPFAVEVRYDLDFFPEQSEAASALAITKQIRDAVLRVIDLP
ncbi:HEPN domain-containing protein [Thermosynechococcaceae cyanobacterium BACA0444]|uniref:HEPN domain-containing protein n=1 Tax=Pseudocalidococcus azoricus BACA0444 TaxID=2918990 RepID=A0AAE4FRK1_9CYAN|nr:HEPN domain-containing protein [Pseudocalidococcus azoricus]MDS3861003.1 HEPN domain-containing protein [Pseudocalidococcus azoricus BACA0444]